MNDPLRPRIAVTAGEPAGIGPELLLKLATTALPADFVAITDRTLLERTAVRCQHPIKLIDADDPELHPTAGMLRVQHVPLGCTERLGHPDPRNATHVLATLNEATDGCIAGRYDAVVTAPLQKSSINEIDRHFSGHTAFFAQRTHTEVVMMLASPELRIALVTMHLPLSQVSAAITGPVLERSLHILHQALRTRFGLTAPRIAVLGLNPHAGEQGYLGREEIDILIPVIKKLCNQGMHLIGPLPADTAFIPAQRQRYDAVLAMYHDQALPVIKSEDFAHTVNITLGLPFIRTSVDHGTALDLAATGGADPTSLIAAARMALTLIEHSHK